MATIKVTSSKRGNIKALVNYLTNKEKTEEKLISAKDCNPDKVVRDFVATKELYNKKDGRQYHHYVQSFKPGEVTPEKAHEIGKELAQNFKGHEVFIVTHRDKDHIHNHLVVNSVNFENGKKLHTSKHDLKKFKQLNDRICEREGLSVIRNSKGQYLSKAQIQLAERGENSQLKLINSIRHSRSISTSKDEFIKNMDKLGYEVDWGNRKRIGFIDKQLKERNEQLKEQGKKGVKFKYTERALSKYGIDKLELSLEALENEFRRNAQEKQQSSNRRTETRRNVIGRSDTDNQRRYGEFKSVFAGADRRIKSSSNIGSRYDETVQSGQQSRKSENSREFQQDSKGSQYNRQQYKKEILDRTTRRTSESTGTNQKHGSEDYFRAEGNDREVSAQNQYDFGRQNQNSPSNSGDQHNVSTSCSDNSLSSKVTDKKKGKKKGKYYEIER